MSLLQDFRYALRGLLRSPSLMLMAVASLTIGIGATTTIFSMINGLLLRPVPGLTGQKELVNVHPLTAEGKLEGGLSFPNYEDLAKLGGDELAGGVIAFRDRSMSLTLGSRSEMVAGLFVTGNYFSVLGVRPALGRFFDREADAAPTPSAVISHSLWQSRFAGDESVIGRKITINGQPLNVVGVTQREFRSTFILFPFDIWVPMSILPVMTPDADMDTRGSESQFEISARLGPGVSLERGQQRLENIARQLREEFPKANEDLKLGMHPLTGVDDSLRGGVAAFMALLLVVTGMVLLIACGNIANLLLARAASRFKELAIRLSLGASRRQLVRQLLTESLLISFLGGIGGVLVSLWATRLMRVFEPPIDIPLLFDFSIDHRVLLFAFLVALLSGVVIGIVPALKASRPDLVSALKEGSERGSGRSRAQTFFVVVQVAVSLLLLICAGLFLRALDQATSLDPGFEPEGVMIAIVDMRLLGASETDPSRFFDQLLKRLEALPGSSGASIVRSLPMGFGSATLPINVAGFEPPAGEEAFKIDTSVVGNGYFSVLRIPLLRGRVFEERDREGAPKVAIINQTMAEKFWPDASAVGQAFRHEDESVEVIGVVANGKYRSLSESARAFVYRPFAQAPSPTMTALVRTREEASFATDVRREVTAIEKNLPVLNVSKMKEFMGISLLPQRMAGSIAGILGAIGLLLAAIGIYGVVAYGVSCRRRELGIRMSLGADRSGLIRLVVGEGMRVVLIGVLIGAVSAFLLTRLFRGLLHGVSPADPLVFLGIALILTATALVANLIPARKASRVDPASVLRSE